MREFVSSSEQLVVLARASGGAPPEDDELRFVQAVAADGRRYARDIGTDSPTTFAARLSDSTTCFLVTSGDRVLHATWATKRAAWTRELRAYFVVPVGGCYVYESFTRDDARGRAIYPFALKSICSWAEREGLDRVWVGVEASNSPSLTSVAKAGFEPELTISYRRNVGRLEVTGGECPEPPATRLCVERDI